MDRDALVCNKVVMVHLEKSSLGSMQHLMHCDAAKARCTEEAITDDHCLSKHQAVVKIQAEQWLLTLV